MNTKKKHIPRYGVFMWIGKTKKTRQKQKTDKKNKSKVGVKSTAKWGLKNFELQQK